MSNGKKCPECGSLNVCDKSHEGNVGGRNEGKEIPRSKVTLSPRNRCEDCGHKF